MTQTKEPSVLKVDDENDEQSLGSLTVHSQLIQLRLFSRRTALSNS